MSQIIQINGESYIAKKQPEPKSSKRMGNMASLMAAMASTHISTVYHRKLPPVDIVKEFGLIEQKKSNLCKAERDHVIYLFNKTYEKLK